MSGLLPSISRELVALLLYLQILEIRKDSFTSLWMSGKPTEKNLYNCDVVCGL